MRFFLVMLAALALPSAAHAEWFESSSAHFVVYADDSERDLRKFSEQLERYHEAMAVITQLDAPPPSPSNRVTVYVVRNAAAVQRLMGTDQRALQGFYPPPARAARWPMSRGSRCATGSPTCRWSSCCTNTRTIS